MARKRRTTPKTPESFSRYNSVEYRARQRRRSLTVRLVIFGLLVATLALILFT